MIQKETKQKREKRKTLEDVRTKIEKKNQKKKNQKKNEKHIMKRQNLTRKKNQNSNEGTKSSKNI